MKVVLFCGGMGMRLRDYSAQIPKPLVEVGQRPVMWHLMRYYAHFGHKEFILCLGHGAAKIKEYFLNYNECTANDFVLSEGGKTIELLNTDIHDWTDLVRRHRSALEHRRAAAPRPRPPRRRRDVPRQLRRRPVGPRSRRLRRPLRRSRRDGSFLSVPAPHTFHIVHSDADNYVEQLELIGRSPVRINAGFFVLRNEIFDVLNPGEELVLEPFQRLIEQRKLVAEPYDGFWQNMDTFKDKVVLDELVATGKPPWQLWSSPFDV